MILCGFGTISTAALDLPDYIYEAQSYQVSLNLSDESIKIIQSSLITCLPETMDSVTLSLPFEEVDVTAVKAVYRSTIGGSFSELNVTKTDFDSQGEITIYFEPALHRYQTARITLHYVTKEPGSLKLYTDGETKTCEFALRVKSESRLGQLEVTIEKPWGWDFEQIVPYTRPSAYRAAPIKWSIDSWGPGEQSFFLLLVPQKDAGIDVLGFIFVGNIIVTACLIAWAVWRLDKIWREIRSGRVEKTISQVIGRYLIVSWALKNLTRKKGRALFTFIGIFVGAAIFSSQFFSVIALATERGVFGIKTYLYAIMAITLLICFFCVVSTMLTSVSERTREIGVMKAIGISSSWVMRLFVTEALFLGLIGGITGCFFGFIGAILPYMKIVSDIAPGIVSIAITAGFAIMLLIFYLSKSRLSVIAGFLMPAFIPLIAVLSRASVEVALAVSFTTVVAILIASLGVIVLVSVLGGLYPAWKAAKMRPVEALA